MSVCVCVFNMWDQSEVLTPFETTPSHFFMQRLTPKHYVSRRLCNSPQSYVALYVYTNVCADPLRRV